jgi:hypothetical protein
MPLPKSRSKDLRQFWLRPRPAVAKNTPSLNGAVAQRLNRANPLLGQGGVDATSNKCREASYEGADGVVGSTTDYSVL